jgi:hypothetical protein
MTDVFPEFIQMYCQQNGTAHWDTISDLIRCGLIRDKVARNYIIRERFPKLQQQHGAMTAYSILGEDYGLSDAAVIRLVQRESEPKASRYAQT